MPASTRTSNGPATRIRSKLVTVKGTVTSVSWVNPHPMFSLDVPTADGKVESTSFQGEYGNLIVINHGFGLESKYGHLLDYSVHQGDRVERGDVIGHVGATGRATGYHLHYEVHANGKLLNPLQLLTQQRPRAQ